MLVSIPFAVVVLQNLQHCLCVHANALLAALPIYTPLIRFYQQNI